jgi:cobalt-zinc-cadmium efflux system protein
MHMTHDHGHHNSGHSHDHAGEASLRRLWWAMLINAAFLLVEFVGGLLTNSLALLSDAGHMLTDVAALAVAIAAAHLARRPPTPRRTFGLLRTEVIGAFLNGVTLVVIVGLIFWKAMQRFAQPVDVDAPVMLAIAAAGLLANAASVAVLLPSRGHSLNIQAAFLHMAADALGSLAAITAGSVIWATGWTPIDALVSLLIGVLILYSTVGLLRRTLSILLNATPSRISYGEVKEALEKIPHFDQIQDLHIWTIASGMDILTAHVRLEPGCSDTTHWQQCLQVAQKMLHEEFGIEHSTLQLEPPGHPGDDRRF